MKICFVGFGSIALRHIKNLKILYREKAIIDLLRSKSYSKIDSRYENLIHNIYYDYESLPNDYDVIFITNPTKLHYETLRNCQSHGKHFFIEKPIFETGEENLEELGCKSGSVYYVACPLRYTNVIKYLKENIDFSKVYSVRCISSSYLPDWRPGVDYRTTYSARKELGGGVAIDLIHEWDYLCYLLGVPQTVMFLSGKKSVLEINSEDIALYLAEYPDKFVELHLDYFGRIPSRKIELYCENDIVEADLINQRIAYKRNNTEINLEEERDSYQIKELQYFFELINNREENTNTIETACKILRLAGGKI